MREIFRIHEMTEKSNESTLEDEVDSYKLAQNIYSIQKPSDLVFLFYLISDVSIFHSTHTKYICIQYRKISSPVPTTLTPTLPFCVFVCLLSKNIEYL